MEHLQLEGRHIKQDYTPNGGGPRPVRIPRNRAAHGGGLLSSLRLISARVNEYSAIRRELNIEAPEGIIIEFKSLGGFELEFESLDLRSSGFELLNVRRNDNVTYATVFVPTARLEMLRKRITDYLNKDTKSGKPANAALVESIESMGLATISALWTDIEAIPEADEERWFEVWIRLDNLAAENAFLRFSAAAQAVGLQIAEQRLNFPERIVLTLRSSISALSGAINVLNLIAEIRHADRPPRLPHRMTTIEQDEFVASIQERLAECNDDISIAILDTGVARAHPLLEPALNTVDLHTVDATWGTHDHHGHGTSMAGLALYGNLRDHAGSADPIILNYCIESSKVVDPNGAADADGKVLGAVTQQAVSRCEIQAPHRRRIICKAVTSAMHQTGEPSSYSSAMDQLAFGDEETKRLCVVSAGNVPDDAWLTYPHSNYGYGVEQPAQAWNVLTVGAYTELEALPGTIEYAGWSHLAPARDLSPFSSTSRAWDRKWPVKPEVLFEGGNAAIDVSRTQCAIPDSMKLLTTARNHNVRPLTSFCMTSAATALAANFAATLTAQYPDYWPETIRGLMVHSAEWSQQQVAAHLIDSTSASKNLLLRSCGYGVPSMDRALTSTQKYVCMVVQDTIQPFALKNGRNSMNEQKLFELPWPRQLLEELGETPVRLKITLSYFVEPNPSHRSWDSKYRYSSHGLRFKVQRPNQTELEFVRSTNRAMNPDRERFDTPQDFGWVLGEDLRNFGSIHSDTWKGNAIDLLGRNLLSVHPIVGWWRERPHLGKLDTVTRYSLIVSLEVDNDVNVELYDQISNVIDNELTILPGLEAELANVLGVGNENLI